MAGAIRSMYKGGGAVRGAGSGTSDHIPIKVSPGEYVLPADTVKKIGPHVLDLLRLGTHKRVNPKQGPIRRMADGGLVDENWRGPDVGATASDAMGNGANLPAAPAPQADTNYGQQALAAAGSVANTVFGAKGQGISSFLGNSPSAPGPISGLANPTDQREAAGTQTTPLAAPEPAPAPDPSVPSLGGQAGTAVAGAPGVSRFKTAGGGTLYSNVPGSSSNDSLMNRGPISAMNQQALDNIQARQDAGDNNRALQAQQKQEEADAIATNAQGGFGTGEANMDPRTMLMRTLQRGKLNVHGAQALGAMMTNDVAGGQLGVAQQKLALEAPEQIAKTQGMIATLAARKRLSDAIASGDSDKIDAAREDVQGQVGHWTRPFPELYSTTGLPATYGPNGERGPSGAIVTDRRTGDTRIIMQKDLQPQGTPAAGVQVGASTKQPDGSYAYFGKTLTVKNGKIVSLQ